MADTMNFGPEWLRNLSGGSSGGFTNSHSGGGGGGTTGGSSSNNTPSSLPLKLPTPTTPTAAYAKKFPLATHRYGREELLQMFSDDVPFPGDMPDFPPATRKQLLIPLSFMPVSEEEQLALSGGMNSESVYGVRGGRGGGYYPMRGRPGRGRGRGEAGFHRTPSYEEFHHPWTATEGRGVPAYTPTGRGGSRALKDGNWRSPTTPIETSEEPLPNWGNHWHPPPSPGKVPPTIPRGGGTSGGREGWRDGNRTWQVLPEWASDDVITSSTVGTFDSSGMFTTPVDKAAKPPDEGSLREPRGRQTSESEPPEAPPSSTSTSQPQDTSSSNSCNNRTNGTPGSLPLSNETMKQPPPEFQHRRSNVREEFRRKVRESIEDPLQDGGGLPIPSQPPAPPSAHVVQKPSPVQKPIPASVAAQTSGGGLLTTTPPSQVGSGSMLSDSINSVVNSSLLHSGGHVTSHMMSHDQDDSVFSPSSVDDDHMKHIEKAAEALLSTEEEETPTTSPTIPPPTSTLPITTAHTHPQSLPPPPSHQLPGIPPQMNPEDAHKWLYKDPQGEIQGPFPARDMKEWFDCGYFTMDLMVRRVCDGGMLPLGQVIRIWGRVPFTTSGQHPPPIRLNDPFWQRVFQQQQQLMLQQQQQAILHLQKQQQQPAPPGTTQSQAVGPRPPVVPGGPPQQPTPTTPTTMASESIWTRNTPKEVGNEDQWPDITGEAVWKSSPEPSPDKEKQRQLEEARRVKELERLAAAKEKRQLEEERRRREEEERLKAQEERQRREEEAKAERQRQEKATRRRAEEEMKRREMEKQRLMEEEARMMQRLQEEREHLRQQEAEEERRMAMERQQALERQQWQQQALPWVTTPPGRPSAPSLLQIQQEEEVQAAHEQHRKEEMMRIHMQQTKQLQQQQLGWGSGVRGGGSKPKSFLEIQLEQEGDAPKETSGGGGGGGAVSRPLKVKETSSWSTIAATKQPPPAWSPIAPIGPQKSKSLSISLDNEADDEEEDELSFWNECARVAKKNPPRVVSNPPPPPQSAPPQKKRTDREEENVRRLFSANSASDEFNKWCEQELKTFNTDVDAATFISFLLEVDSVYEVHDYIKSYLGETGEAHDFAKQFLERRQKLKIPSQQGSQSKKSKSRDRSGSHGSSEHSETKGASGRQEGGWEEGGGGSRSSKKKKKKMQKVNPAAMLGFTVNAAERPNMGEIQSVHDVL